MALLLQYYAKTENVGYKKMAKSNLQIVRDLWLGEQAQPKQTVFSETDEPLTIEDKREFAQSLQNFSTLAETVTARGERLQEAVKRITKMCETATKLVNESGDDMVERVAAGRHMKLIDEALKAFQKSSNEVMIHERRMEAAYHDITDGLKKYYDVQ